MRLNETYSSVLVGKHLSDTFPFRKVLKQRSALSSLFLKVAVEKAIRRVQVNQDGVKLNGTHQLLVYADDIILGGSVHTANRNVEALVVATKETGLEVIADKTKYIVMSRDQDAGRSNSVRTDNNSFERV